MHAPTISTLIDYGLRSALLLGMTGAAAWLLRERSSAWRHLVWLAGLTGLLALPAAKALAPQWNTPMMRQSMLAAPMRTVINVTSSAAGRNPGRVRPLDGLLFVWLAGTAFLVIRFGRGQVLARRLAKEASPGSGGLLVSVETDVPIVCGLWRPVIVLPIESESWPVERLESVLRHERMHIARRDTLSQGLAQLVCAIYWPQPLVWLAAAALRNTCEQACDDGVLSQGTKPSAYAGHLMEIARALPKYTASAALEGGIAMTRTNLLEERISALLNPKRDRRQAGASFSATVAALAVTVVIALAAVRTPLLAQSGRLTGVVRDPSGAVVPFGARIDIRTSTGTPATAAQATSYHEIVRSNAAGEFSLENVPDGTYDITISAPGFAKQEHQGVLFESGKAKPMDIQLQLGAVHEQIQVQAQGFASPAPGASAVNPQRIRVGGNVQAANLIYKSTPMYPADAKADGVEGTVLMSAVIGKDGSILSLAQVNKLVDPRLATTAIEAVKQWRYKPTLLNGEPVEVVTQIEVNFTLTH